MKKTDSRRLFIAITLPETARENISRLIRELDGRIPGSRWTPAENIHLTLKFLGAVAAAKIPQIQNCLDRVAGCRLPLAVRLEGLGVFPAGGRPRVVWAGVGEGREELRGLAEELDRGLAELGFPPEVRSYTPHLTLGRAQNSREKPDSGALGREIERRKRDWLGAFPADMIVLMQSILTPKGAIHQVVSRHGGRVKQSQDRINST